MLYRVVPKNGDRLSVLGYGCMRLPMRLHSVDEKLAESQIMHAVDRGVNYFDTAYSYHKGKSESFLGKIFSENNCRDSIKIATKLPHWMTGSKSDMDKILNEQLRRLKTDHIDYYLIHGLSGKSWEDAKYKGVLEFMDDGVEKGKIINAGFSFHGGADEFEVIVDSYDWIFCQIQYNYLDVQYQAGTRGLRYAASKDMAVMIMEPLRGGNLARTTPISVQNIWSSANQKRTSAAWSLGWIWNHPEVTLVLSGMNNDEHINENLALAEKALPQTFSENDLQLVALAAEEFRKIVKIRCTGCRYCMPCPSKVNIPGCFDCYNSMHTFKDKRAKLRYYFHNSGFAAEGSATASSCVQCGICIEKCPQHLPIPDLLKIVQDDMEGAFSKLMVWLVMRAMRVRKMISDTGKKLFVRK